MTVSDTRTHTQERHIQKPQRHGFNEWRKQNRTRPTHTGQTSLDAQPRARRGTLRFRHQCLKPLPLPKKHAPRSRRTIRNGSPDIVTASLDRKTKFSSARLLNLARPATRQFWRASRGLAKSVVVACSRCASLIWSRVATWLKCASRYFCQTSQRKTGIARPRAHFAPSTTPRTTTPNTSTRNTHRKKQGSTDL